MKEVASRRVLRGLGISSPVISLQFEGIGINVRPRVQHSPVGRRVTNPGKQGSVSLTVATPAEADRLFGALAEGGQVQMPLAKTFFSQRFGMLADRFGVKWMVLVTPGGPK